MPDRSENNTNNTNPNVDALTPKQALDAKRDFLSRIPDSQVSAVFGLDPETAVMVAIGCLPRIAKHRAEIVAEFGERGAAIVDDLPVVANATRQAIVELAGADSMSDLSPMHDDLLAEHALLVGDADALANRKLVDRKRIDAGRPIQGYRNVVTSTLVLVAFLREVWPAVVGKTMLTTEDLERAEKKAHRMATLLDEREVGSTRLPAIEMRNRAVSHLISVYSQLRRMVTYVRWDEGDADTIAPSFYAGRRRSRNGATEPTDGDEPLPVTPIHPAEPVPNNGGAPFTT